MSNEAGGVISNRLCYLFICYKNVIRYIGNYIELFKTFEQQTKAVLEMSDSAIFMIFLISPSSQLDMWHRVPVGLRECIYLSLVAIWPPNGDQVPGLA